MIYAGRGVREQFHKTVLRFHDDGLAVVGERIAGSNVRNVLRKGFLFGQADFGHLRFGEHNGSHQPVVYPAWFFWMRDVACSHFTLHHCVMNDLKWAGAVTGSINVRGRGLHFLSSVHNCGSFPWRRRPYPT